jgi:CBS domain-containing protein
VDADKHLVGVVRRSVLQRWPQLQAGTPIPTLGELAAPEPVTAYPDEPLRIVVPRMAETGLTRVPVVERGDERTLVSMISLNDLLKARAHNLEAERRRERVLPRRLVFPRWPLSGDHAS